MKALGKRAGVLALLAVLVAVPAGLVALESCAQFITTGAGDEPNAGYLIGERTVSITTVTTYSGGYDRLGFKGSMTSTRTVSESYAVGTYVMSDGTIRSFRCDTYTAV